MMAAMQCWGSGVQNLSQICTKNLNLLLQCWVKYAACELHRDRNISQSLQKSNQSVFMAHDVWMTIEISGCNHSVVIHKNILLYHTHYDTIRANAD